MRSRKLFSRVERMKRAVDSDVLFYSFIQQLYELYWKTGMEQLFGLLYCNIIQIDQMGDKSILVLTFFIYLVVSFKDCNFTQFDFLSTYSLGKQDELNKTFDALNSKISNLTSIQFKSQKSVVYRIQQARPSFNYLDSKQTAEIIGEDIIYVKGGKVSTEIVYNWSKDQMKGTGTAVCLSDSISFAKLLYLSLGFMNFKLADYRNVTFYQTVCNITRVNPVLQKEDIDILATIINDLQPNNLRAYLQQQIARNYQSILNNSLYDERQPLDNKYSYNWIDPNPEKTNLTIQYTLLPTGAHLQPIGLFLSFITQITDDQNWECGATVPSSPMDPQIYGGIQQFFSFSILQNSLRYALEKGQLNTKIYRRNWQSQVFQFYAGDLYQIIPLIMKRYYASQEVSGTCNATTKGLKLSKSSNETLSVQLSYLCQLSLGVTRVNSFDIDLTLTVKVLAVQDRLDFQVIKCDKFAHFKDEGEFQIYDIELANFFLGQSLKRLYVGKVFGSGWKIYSRNYPQVKVEDQYIFIYDAGSSQ